MPEDLRSGTPGGAWSAPLEQLRLATRQPVLTALSELGVVAARGPDTAPFLNSQLTVDVTTVDARRWQLGAYCSPKGRAVALFEMWRVDDGFCLLLPAEQTEPLRSRLARYVLRSKVRLDDATGSWVVFGLTGPGIEEALRSAGLHCPGEAWTSQPQDDGGRLVQLPASPRTGARLMLIVHGPTSEAWRKNLAAIAQVDAGVWWWSKIDAGLPDVFAVTQERFVPQMLNLDVLGAVHFGKGCYPGQEIVARNQYLGKLRRRMMRAHADRGSAGEDIFDQTQGADGGPAGTVVMAAGSPEGGVDLLFECRTDVAGTAQLRVGQAQSASMRLGELPYPMINPTA
jgi:tRNA-modifying protein YgfZ